MRFTARIMTACACAAALLGGMPARANSAAAEYFRDRADRSAVPKLLSEDERTYYQALFAAIRRREWTNVQTMLAARPEGLLHGMARAEYFTAPGSPRIELDQLTQWLAAGAELPQADTIAGLAAKRGATALPSLPQPQPLVALTPAPRRTRPHDIADATMPATAAAAILERIKADDAPGARQLLDGVDALLSPEARAEWRQKVAWSYYIENDDADAYALGASAGADPANPTAGAWTAEGWFTAGLAAWRIGDCEHVAAAFDRAAHSAANPELAAAGYFWQSRALVRCREPEGAAAPLRAAARLDETLYGMLAAESLGLRAPQARPSPDFSAAEWQQLRNLGNVRVAVALAEIGEDGLADEVLRHQARIGAAADYQALTRLARDLGLAGTQLWMAYNAPAGASAAPASRYPTPKWSPVTGWQVDPALVYAHSLEESRFRTTAVSPKGARGLMQIVPAAAHDHAAALGVAGTAADLTRPEINLAMGQEHLQALQHHGATGGLLPKVIAAYNAGPLPVAKWNSQIRDGGDPLLWIESVPYWETRGYVATVLRNYWMYESQAGGASDSRLALVQGSWPSFPTMTGTVRLSANDVVERAQP